MVKWFALFLILTVAVGFYWMVMTGTWGDRTIAVELRGTIKEVSPADIVRRLEAVRERIDAQAILVKKLAFLARTPDWSHVRAARGEADRLLAAANRAAVSSQEVGETEAAEALRTMIRDAPAISVETFYPPQRTFWTVLFWVFAVPTALFGLLSFVRAAPS